MLRILGNVAVYAYILLQVSDVVSIVCTTIAIAYLEMNAFESGKLHKEKE